MLMSLNQSKIEIKPMITLICSRTLNKCGRIKISFEQNITPMYFIDSWHTALKNTKGRCWHSIHTFLAFLLCKIQLILPRKVSQSPLHKHFLCQFPRSSTSDKHSLLPSWRGRKQNEFNKMKKCMEKKMPAVKCKWNAV